MKKDDAPGRGKGRASEILEPFQTQSSKRALFQTFAAEQRRKAGESANSSKRIYL